MHRTFGAVAFIAGPCRYKRRVQLVSLELLGGKKSPWLTRMLSLDRRYWYKELVPELSIRVRDNDIYLNRFASSTSTDTMKICASIGSSTTATNTRYV